MVGSSKPWFYTAGQTYEPRKRVASEWTSERESKRPRYDEADLERMDVDRCGQFNDSSERMELTIGEDAIKHNGTSPLTTKQQRKKLSNQQKAAQAAEDILDRAGFRAELLFGGEGKIGLCSVDGSERDTLMSTSIVGKRKVVHSVDLPVAKKTRVGRPNSQKAAPGSRLGRPNSQKAAPRSRLGRPNSHSVAPGSRLGRPSSQKAAPNLHSVDENVATASRHGGKRKLGEDLPPIPNEPPLEPQFQNPWIAQQHQTSLIDPPLLADGTPVTGSNKKRYKSLSKWRRQQKQMEQPNPNYWVTHEGSLSREPSFTHPSRDSYRGGMCPSNLALEHPAAPLLKSYATDGCPVDPG